MKAVRPFEIYRESHPLAKAKQMYKCKLPKEEPDGCLTAISLYTSQEGSFSGYPKLKLEPNDNVVIVSASVENTYLLFGYKDSYHTNKRMIDSAEIFAIEGTTIKPQFENYPLG